MCVCFLFLLQAGSADKKNSGVTISTIHSAKGLEWNTVFVLHFYDGMLPSVFRYVWSYQKQSGMLPQVSHLLEWLQASRSCDRLLCSTLHHHQHFLNPNLGAHARAVRSTGQNARDVTGALISFLVSFLLLVCWRCIHGKVGVGGTDCALENPGI